MTKNLSYDYAAKKIICVRLLIVNIIIILIRSFNKSRTIIRLIYYEQGHGTMSVI